MHYTSRSHRYCIMCICMVYKQVHALKLVQGPRHLSGIRYMYGHISKQTKKP